MRGFHRIGFFLLSVLLLTLGITSRCVADERPVASVADLFESDVLADNVFGLRMAAMSLPVEARYEIFKSHVLPGKLHREFRLFGKLTSTDPPESATSDHPVDVARIQEGINRKQKRVRTGGILVSPVFDLIAAAKEAGKLDELRFAVQAATATGEVQQRCQLTLLAMIAIAKGDLVEAARSVDDLHKRFVNLRFDRLQDRMPETLFLWMAVEQGVLLDEALQYLVSILDSQIRAGKSSGPTEWNVLMIHLIGWIQHHKLPPGQRTQPWTAAPDLKSWHPVTRKSSWTNGLGLPPGHFQAGDGAVDVLAKTDDEFLLFGSPLRGNYTLECFCTCFGWKEIHPQINGSWVTPVWHHESVQAGELYRVAPEIPMQPKLSRVDNWLRYRVDVRDGFCSRYINSRLISREPLPKEHDPWVAIRNPGTGTGSIRNVRITGTPVIPDSVRISDLRSGAWKDSAPLKDADKSATSELRPISHLSGWITWHEDPWTPEKQLWKVLQDSSGTTQIVGQSHPELNGAGEERMLRYVWPLVWDSEVTYEFFCDDGKSIVHPSLGRTAFLIEHTGVAVHETTNGIWEDSHLDPLHRSMEGNRVSMASLPLKSGEWNQMVFQINGDLIRLRLNDVLIHESDVAATNDRCFGLFYYCDQTEARVRNIVLKGDWPKTVPPVAEQELRGTETDTLDSERIALPDSFEFDFTNKTDEELESDFIIADEKRQRARRKPPGADSLNSVLQLLNKPDWDVFLEPDGLHMRGEAGPKTSSTSSVGPRIKIDGDFDVIAEFSDLKIKPSDNGIAAIYLGPRIVLKEFEAHLLFRGIVQHPNTPLRELTQVELLRSGAKGFRYEYPAIYADECRSGRLRVARRGTKFHYLIAPLDSDNFRLLHSIEGPDISILNGNFLLRTSCYSQGAESSEVSVVWKNVSIRAESIEDNRTSGLRNLYLLDLRKVPVGNEENKTASPAESIRQLEEANEEYTQAKWPTWSQDGRSVVFEMNNGQYSLLTSLALDGSQMSSFAVGTLPGLSPDGTQIVVTQEGRGLKIHAMNNFNGASLDLDPEGQSGTWSPDGRFIAWIAKKRIVVYDVKTQQRRILPPEDQPTPYKAIEKGLGWSRDSKSLAFKARLTKDEGNAVAIVAMDIDKPDKPDVLYTGVRLHSDVSWHPDGNQVLFSGLDPSTGTPQMFIVKRNAPEKLIPVPGQPRDWRIIDCDWSPDGHQIVFTAEPPL
ncbi:MAG: DUF1583 domain-containing protein [Planctomycetaceae bacterium]